MNNIYVPPSPSESMLRDLQMTYRDMRFASQDIESEYGIIQTDLFDTHGETGKLEKSTEPATS